MLPAVNALTGGPDQTVAWIEQGKASDWRTVIFRDGTCRYGVHVDELRSMNIDPNANVNFCDPSLTDSEWKKLAATVGLTQA